MRQVRRGLLVRHITQTCLGDQTVFLILVFDCTLLRPTGDGKVKAVEIPQSYYLLVHTY
jgi:hypothetical protein